MFNLFLLISVAKREFVYPRKRFRIRKSTAKRKIRENDTRKKRKLPNFHLLAGVFDKSYCAQFKLKVNRSTIEFDVSLVAHFNFYLAFYLVAAEQLICHHYCYYAREPSTPTEHRHQDREYRMKSQPNEHMQTFIFVAEELRPEANFVLFFSRHVLLTFLDDRQTADIGIFIFIIIFCSQIMISFSITKLQNWQSDRSMETSKV